MLKVCIKKTTTNWKKKRLSTPVFLVYHLYKEDRHSTYMVLGLLSGFTKIMHKKDIGSKLAHSLHDVLVIINFKL